MSKLIKDNFPFIQLLLETKSKAQREALFQTITREQVKSVIEITYNIINLNVPLSKNERRKLVRHIDLFKAITNKKKSLKSRTVLIRSNQANTLMVIKAAFPSLQKIISK